MLAILNGCPLFSFLQNKLGTYKSRFPTFQWKYFGAIQYLRNTVLMGITTPKRLSSPHRPGTQGRNDAHSFSSSCTKEQYTPPTPNNTRVTTASGWLFSLRKRTGSWDELCSEGAQVVSSRLACKTGSERSLVRPRL